MSLSSRFLAGLARAGYAGDSPLAIAFSGGLDSTALLALAVGALPCERLLALHVDHGARPDSAVDAVHCEAVAQQLGVAYAAARLSPDEVAQAVAAEGPEGGLRAARYQALARLCSERDVAGLAVAHQADDLLESHLLALCRGSGLIGLGGPRWTTRRGRLRILRPCLEMARGELRAYLEAEHSELRWVDDPTNRERRYARNRLRHEALPVLREVAGGDASLRRAMANLHDDREAFEALLGRALADAGVDRARPSLDLSALLAAQPPWPERVTIEALRRFVAAHSGGYPPSRGHVRRLYEALVEPGRTRWIDLPGLRLRVADHEVTVEATPPVQPEAVPLPVGAVTSHPQLGLSLQLALVTAAEPAHPDNRRLAIFDADALGGLSGLSLRGARDGDRFRPFGLGGSTRLKRWLAGRGIERAARALVPVVTQGERVLWVIGHRRSDAAPVTKSTQRRLILRVLASGSPGQARERDDDVRARDGGPRV